MPFGCPGESPSVTTFACRQLQTLSGPFFCLFGAPVWGKGVMTWVPRVGGSQEGTTGDFLSHQPEFMGTPLNYYKLWESHQVSPHVCGEGHFSLLLNV